MFTTAPKPLRTSPATIWPPNHKLVPVTVDTPGGYIPPVTSSEPDSGVGNGDLVNDTVMIPPLTVTFGPNARTRESVEYAPF